MSIEADVNHVMRRLYNPDFTIENEDVPMIRSEAASLLGKGWSVDEVTRYLRCTEHVTPSLSEDVAVARMKAIREQAEERLR